MKLAIFYHVYPGKDWEDMFQLRLVRWWFQIYLMQLIICTLVLMVILILCLLSLVERTWILLSKKMITNKKKLIP